jgi:hypothetical protein
VLLPVCTLAGRNKKFDPTDLNLSQAELIERYNTSQFASARALNGDRERLDDPPFKLQTTYEAIDHWQAQREQRQMWVPHYDPTINRQVGAYLAMLGGPAPDFEPQQSEDFCFAYAFGYTSLAEAAKRWPELAGHESNRPEEMPAMMKAAQRGEIITSRDHRVVQAIAMWATVVLDKEVKFDHPQAVNKSWPQFWKLMEATAPPR